MRRFAIILLLVVLAAGAAYRFWPLHSASPAGGPSAALPAAVPPGAAMEDVTCYFPGRTGMDLVEETRQRVKGTPPLDRLRVAMACLHRGPSTPAGLPVFPAGLVPRAVFLTPEGVAYLDEPAAAWDRPTGLREELLAIRAIARTILRQCPEVHALVFLTDGAPRTRLTAHCPALGRYLLPRLRAGRAGRTHQEREPAPDTGADTPPTTPDTR